MLSQYLDFTIALLNLVFILGLDLGSQWPLAVLYCEAPIPGNINPGDQKLRFSL